MPSFYAQHWCTRKRSSLPLNGAWHSNSPSVASGLGAAAPFNPVRLVPYPLTMFAHVVLCHSVPCPVCVTAVRDAVWCSSGRVHNGPQEQPLHRLLLRPRQELRGNNLPGGGVGGASVFVCRSLWRWSKREVDCSSAEAAAAFSLRRNNMPFSSRIVKHFICISGGFWASGECFRREGRDWFTCYDMCLCVSVEHIVDLPPTSLLCLSSWHRSARSTSSLRVLPTCMPALPARPGGHTSFPLNCQGGRSSCSLCDNSSVA